MRKTIELLVTLLALASCTHSPRSGARYAERYLNDAATPIEFKTAIREGLVVLGMCPFEAFAAAGLPESYSVMADDTVWGPDTIPPTIIDAQCERPDKSVIDLRFHNKTQFKSKTPTWFRVRFQQGKAVLIDTKDFRED